VSVLFGVTLTGTGVGVGYAIWYNHTHNKESNFEITRIKNTTNSLLTNNGDEIVLQATSANGKQAINVDWSGLDTISGGIDYDQHIPSILIIKATRDLVNEDRLDI
jgi:hypothetical protein